VKGRRLLQGNEIYTGMLISP